MRKIVVDVIPMEVTGFESMTTRTVERVVTEYAGRIATKRTIIELPDSMEEPLHAIVQKIASGEEPLIDCSYLAHQFNGLTDFTPGQFWANSGDWSAQNLPNVGNITPGTTIAFGKYDPEQGSYKSVHWGIACGEDLLVQVAGPGGGVIVSSIEDARAIFDAEIIKQMIPRDL